MPCGVASLLPAVPNPTLAQNARVGHPRRRWLQEMLTITKRFERFVLFCITLTLTGLAIGCESFPESTFELASESRLPKWITLPPGMTRADVSLTMSYYVWLWGRSATFILRNKKGQVLEKVKVRLGAQDPTN